MSTRTRRRFLVTSAATGLVLGIGGPSWAQSGLAVTPACHDGDEPTPR